MDAFHGSSFPIGASVGAPSPKCAADHVSYRIVQNQGEKIEVDQDAAASPNGNNRGDPFAANRFADFQQSFTGGREYSLGGRRRFPRRK